MLLARFPNSGWLCRPNLPRSSRGYCSTATAHSHIQLRGHPPHKLLQPTPTTAQRQPGPQPCADRPRPHRAATGTVATRTPLTDSADLAGFHAFSYSRDSVGFTQFPGCLWLSFAVGCWLCQWLWLELCPAAVSVSVWLQCGNCGWGAWLTL
jgi:hypothetical protein